MTSREELEMWKKLLGVKMSSFTHRGVDYTLFLGENGWECSCMDFGIRHGSHQYEFIEDGKLHKLQACKHIGQHLANQGIEIYEIHGYGYREKLKPQQNI